MTNFEDVRRICLSLPSTTEGPSYGTPGFRVKDKLFARMREDPDALVVFRPHIAEKEALIASDPDKFFQTPHYEGYPAVLVRLEAMELNELEEVLTESWALKAPRKVLEDWDENRCHQ